MDDKLTIENLKEKVKSFCEIRDWDQFHDPKDIAIGISTEANELLEHFRFKDKVQQKECLDNDTKKEEIAMEAADVFFFLLRFCQMNNINLSESLNKKMAINNNKYPIYKSKGSNKKYTELDD
jgi:NTP pyrophosphatase (non-canonical NTP hydrolase)